MCKILYKKYRKYQISIPTDSIATCSYIKLRKGTIHKVSSSNLVIFRKPFSFVRFQTIEWCHKNKRCVLLPWPPFSPLESTYFTDVPKRDEINTKNCKKITTYNFLTNRGVYLFRYGIFQGYFTWPCTDIC